VLIAWLFTGRGGGKVSTGFGGGATLVRAASPPAGASVGPTGIGVNEESPSAATGWSNGGCACACGCGGSSVADARISPELDGGPLGIGLATPQGPSQLQQLQLAATGRSSDAERQRSQSADARTGSAELVRFTNSGLILLVHDAG
jgi:hypothetical protein